MTSLFHPFDTIVRKADQYEIDLPPETIRRYRELLDILERAAECPSNHELQAAVAKCVEAGRDPLSDPDIADLAVRRELGNSHLQATLEMVARDLLIEDSVAVFASFAPAFDRAATVLKKAHATLGNIHLNGPPPDQKGKAWDHAQVAERVILDIQLLWKTLSMIHGSPFRYERPYSTLIITDPSPEQWLDVRPDTLHVRPYDAVCADLPLSLATGPDVYRERIDRLVAYNAQIEAERQAAERQRRQRGVTDTSRRLTLADVEAASGV